MASIKGDAKIIHQIICTYIDASFKAVILILAGNIELDFVYENILWLNVLIFFTVQSIE